MNYFIFIIIINNENIKFNALFIKVIKFIIIFMLLIDLIHNSQYDNVVCFTILILFLIILILVYCFLKKRYDIKLIKI